MKIVEIGSEFAPLAKVGGLGDVLPGLSRSLKGLGHEVEVILPKYDILDLNAVEDLHVFQHDFMVPYWGNNFHNSIWKGKIHGLSLILVESHDPYEFFERGHVYGSPDDVDRFLYFCRAAFEYLDKIGGFPDILHIHDWHTAALASIVKESKKCKSKVVLTLHNLAYQGHALIDELNKIEIKDKSPFRSPQGPNFNLLHGGILLADAVTTVSPTYASEILGSLGFGLEKALASRKKDFFGILNGIDYEIWNPSTDPALPSHFRGSDLESTPPYLAGKNDLKKHLRRMLSLTEADRPIVSSITRLVPQKGPELIEAMLVRTIQKGGQAILLGSAIDPKIHDSFYHLKRRFASSHDIHIELSYNEKLSHLLYAASDVILVPSIFEPCGLTQMIAMRYGALPIVRKTGGLADSVFDGVNGFSFQPPTSLAACDALDRALDCYSDPHRWHPIMKRALAFDSSWEKSSSEYVGLFENLRKKG